MHTQSCAAVSYRGILSGVLCCVQLLVEFVQNASIPLGPSLEEVDTTLLELSGLCEEALTLQETSG